MNLIPKSWLKSFLPLFSRTPTTSQRSTPPSCFRPLLEELASRILPSSVPLALTGFNDDLVYGAGETSPLTGTNTTFDGSLVLGGNGATNVPAGEGLPVGTITSAVNPAVVFDMQSYSNNVDNAFQLTGATPPATINGGVANPTGTLTLSTPTANLSILHLLVASGNGATTATITLNFAGGTTAQFAGESILDWTNGTGAAISGIGRIQATSDGTPSDTLGNLHELDLTLPVADQGLTLNSVTFTQTSAGANSTSDIFAISADLAPPSVTSISPTFGPAAGGTLVTITGTDLIGATAVDFGTTAALAFSVVNDTVIDAETNPGSGVVDVTVTTAAGTSATSPADRFIYVAAPTVTSISPTSGPLTGGTTVTITGASFSGASAVDFGTTPATSFTVVSPTTITAHDPAGTGVVDVTVTTAAGTSATSPADRFIYVPAPTVMSINPTSGPLTGGTTVTITGASFTGASAVDFGTTPATSFTVDSPTTITADNLAGTGVVDVTVTTDGGTSATSPADQFTYSAAPTVMSISPTSGPLTGGTAW